MEKSYELGDFILHVFCLVDDQLKQLLAGQRLRSRGRVPQLADAEVLTMEIVGEILGLDTDKRIWSYFRNHWLDCFPAMPSRTSFVRQAANLWKVALQVQQRLAHPLGAFLDRLHLVDGFPMPVCHFRRAHFSQVFRGSASFGYCATKQETYYGFKGHLMISGEGIITGLTLTAANANERDALWDLVPGIQGLALGDKGYISAPLHQELLRHGLDLQTPLRSNQKTSQDSHGVKRLKSVRRLVETVIGQLTERFHIQKVRARNLWHHSSRLARKVLSHTVAVFLNRLQGNPPLQLEKLLVS